VQEIECIPKALCKSIKIIGCNKSEKTIDKWQYTDAPGLGQKWVSVKEWLPYPYDLVDIETENNLIKKAWYTGYGWFGYKLLPNEKVCYWRRKERMSIND